MTCPSFKSLVTKSASLAAPAVMTVVVVAMRVHQHVAHAAQLAVTAPPPTAATSLLKRVHPKSKPPLSAFAK
jgi:hypothetical protein